MELNLIFHKIRDKFLNLNVLEKLIFLNIVCFVFPYILNTFFFLFDYSNISIISWFELSSDLKKLIFKPWSIISYSFFHSGFFHLFWNMILLLYSGQIFLNLAKEGLVKRSIKNNDDNDESIFLKSVENILNNKKNKANNVIEKFKINKELDFLYEKK